jgi:hypothetical protein
LAAVQEADQGVRRSAREAARAADRPRKKSGGVPPPRKGASGRKAKAAGSPEAVEESTVEAGTAPAEARKGRRSRR